MLVCCFYLLYNALKWILWFIWKSGKFILYILFVQFVLKSKDKKEAYTSNVAEFDLVMQVGPKLLFRIVIFWHMKKNVSSFACFFFDYLGLDNEIWNTWFRVLFKRRNLSPFRWIQVKFPKFYSIKSANIYGCDFFIWWE